MTVASLEDERADIMDAINHLEKAFDAIYQWTSVDDAIDGITEAKNLLLERKGRINTKIAGMTPRERLTGWDL